MTQQVRLNPSSKLKSRRKKAKKLLLQKMLKMRPHYHSMKNKRPNHKVMSHQ